MASANTEATLLKTIMSEVNDDSTAILAVVGHVFDDAAQLGISISQAHQGADNLGERINYLQTTTDAVIDGATQLGATFGDVGQRAEKAMRVSPLKAHCSITAWGDLMVISLAGLRGSQPLGRLLGTTVLYP